MGQQKQEQFQLQQRQQQQRAERHANHSGPALSTAPAPEIAPEQRDRGEHRPKLVARAVLPRHVEPLVRSICQRQCPGHGLDHQIQKKICNCCSLQTY